MPIRCAPACPASPASRCPRTASAPARRRGAAKAGNRASRSTSAARRSEEHTSELQSLMRISYAVFCLKKKKKNHQKKTAQSKITTDLKTSTHHQHITNNK